MKIVVLDGHTLNPGDLSWEAMQQLGELTVYDRSPKASVIGRAKEAEVIFTNKVILTREELQQLPRLKFIGVLATGYNVVDPEAAREAGIIVTNIPAYSTDSVAQLVFAHILHWANRVGLHAEEVRDGKWTGYRDFMYTTTPQLELAGKKLGIIGFGRIGQAVARIGSAFGMKVMFHNRSVKSGFPEEWEQKDLETVFRESDYLSVNCPLTEDNREFINKELMALMKPTAFLINTARGALVKEQELADALNSGIIAGAGLDVLALEPAREGNPLLTAKNCFITPHIAWATLEARTRLMQTAVHNLKAFLEGRPVNVVN